MVWISKKNPIIQCYVDGRRKLCKDIEIIYEGVRFTVPEGFICDGSSIPRFFWRIIGSPTTGPNLLAGIIHDYIYSSKTFKRDECDRIFYEILVYLGKSKPIAWIMYKAVRFFGGSHY